MLQPTFMDATCPECGASVGWVGLPSDRPKCSKCEHRPPQADLEAADKKLEEMLAADAVRPFEADGRALRRLRLNCRLNLLKASELLGMSCVELSRIERGIVEQPEEINFFEVYSPSAE